MGDDSEDKAAHGNSQINKVIGRDIVRMILGMTPFEYKFKVEAMTTGSPNQKGLDRAYRLLFAHLYRQAALPLAIADCHAFLDYQSRKGHMVAASANEQMTASHEPHWLLLMTAMLYGARECGAEGLADECRMSWFLPHRSLLALCATPSGMVVAPGARSANRVSGNPEPWKAERDAFHQLTGHLPLTRQARKLTSKPLMVGDLDTAGLAIAKMLMADAQRPEGFGGTPSNARLPALACPMTVSRYPGGLVASAPGLGGMDPCPVAWVDFQTGVYGGSTPRQPASPPEFDGPADVVAVRAAA